MTDSAVRDTPASKRGRLVAAACQVLHERGIERTTLADIAQAADVPLGNVYYYFKTKDQLVDAAIKARGDDLTATIAALDRRRTPQSRLKGLVSALVEHRELIARYGCPFGTLAGLGENDWAPLIATTLITIAFAGGAAVPGSGAAGPL
jgi:TetR/AcrR family transcriptional repressor of nem operon